MSEREGYETGEQARRAVARTTGQENASADGLEALLRYVKGSGRGQSTGAERTEPLSDAEIRTCAVDRVIDAGGEVSAAFVSAGSLRLRGKVGCRSEIGLLKRSLANIPSVRQVDLRLEYDIDDTIGAD